MVTVEDGATPLCVSAYAHDVLIILPIREDSGIETLTHIVELYGRISSSKVNRAYSTASAAKRKT